VAEHVFETASSELLHSGRIFALRRDEVRMPGGKTATRDVVENYGAVAVVAMDSISPDGNVALIYQYRHAVDRRLWELPAGLLDVSGEDAHLAAGRELVEEAGMTASTWRVLVDLDSSPGFSDESVRVYLATGLSEVDRPEAHDEEAELMLRWYPIADAAGMVFSGEIVNAIAVAGIMAAYLHIQGLGALRPVEAEWVDRPTAFAARQRRS
jgi:ADP-ribose pyrophosphatase